MPCLMRNECKFRQTRCTKEEPRVPACLPVLTRYLQDSSVRRSRQTSICRTSSEKRRDAAVSRCDWLLQREDESRGVHFQRSLSLFFVVLIWHVEWSFAFMLNGILNDMLKIDGTLKDDITWFSVSSLEQS